MTLVLPAPTGDPISNPPRQNLRPGEQDTQAGFVTDAWLRYFLANGQQLTNSATRMGAVALTGQHASITATQIAAGTTSGVYRASWYARITTPGTNSSSLTVTIGFTDHGLALTNSGSAITGNMTSTAQSGDIAAFYADSIAPITYATTYASSGATAMIYQLYVILEFVLSAQ